MTMKQRNLGNRQDLSRQRVPDDQTRLLLDEYVHAWEAADIDRIIMLLTDGATFPMPPMPVVFHGKDAIRAFISTLFPGKAQNLWKLAGCRANGQPCFAFYKLDDTSQTYQPFALQLLTIEGGLISDATTFGYPSLFKYFGLPEALARQVGETNKSI
jgi:RNA polymerase sigma-70 factor (ECF subfamily)